MGQSARRTTSRVRAVAFPFNKYICYCKAVMLRNKKIKSHLIKVFGGERIYVIAAHVIHALVQSLATRWQCGRDGRPSAGKISLIFASQRRPLTAYW